MFIEILEDELKKRNLTLNKLSKKLNFSQSATSRWKHGSYPSIDVLAEICRYLNISADYLLELEPEPPTPPPDISPQERRLLEYYRLADERGKEYILESAEREAARAMPAKREDARSYNSDKEYKNEKLSG